MRSTIHRGSHNGDYNEHPADPIKVFFASTLCGLLFALCALVYSTSLIWKTAPALNFFTVLWRASNGSYPLAFAQSLTYASIGAGIGFFGHYAFWWWRDRQRQ